MCSTRPPYPFVFETFLASYKQDKKQDTNKNKPLALWVTLHKSWFCYTFQHSSTPTLRHPGSAPPLRSGLAGASLRPKKEP